MTASGYRIVNHVEIEPLKFTAFNVLFTLTSLWLGIFPSFINDFLIHVCLVLTKLNLQRENYMENFGRS